MFDLTPEEATMVVDAVKAKAAQYVAMYGVGDPVLEALAVKLSTVDAPAEEAPAVEETPAAEKAPTKTAKK